MTRKPFRLLRALLGAFSTGARAASQSAPGCRVWLTPLLLGPACALALDIGEIQVHSALNQLFDARIPLPALTPEELGKVSVKLAPPPMFKEFDLERAPILTNLVFSIEYNAEGQVYVKVISTKPIREPSLGLLVEFGWPRGKTFREFTVFLDPVQRLAQRPGERSKTVLNPPAAVSASPPQPVPPAAVSASPPQPVPPTVAAASPPQPVPPTVAAAPEPNEPDAPVADSANPEAVAMTGTEGLEASGKPPLPVEASPAPVRVYRPGDTYGPVAVGEGLWAIALKLRPDPGITRDQMMQALFQANPHAFGKAGIGGLKSGCLLRIPSFQEIADLTGSTTARHWAGMEPSVAAVAATPSGPAPAAMESPASKAAASTLEVFLLEPPVPLEPTVVEAPPPVPTPEAAQPVSALVVVAPEPVASASEPVVAVAAPEWTVPESAAPVADLGIHPLPPIPNTVEVTVHSPSQREGAEERTTHGHGDISPLPTSPRWGEGSERISVEIRNPLPWGEGRVMAKTPVETTSLPPTWEAFALTPTPLPAGEGFHSTALLPTLAHGGEGESITDGSAKTPSPLAGEGRGGGAERLPADLPAEPVAAAPEPVASASEPVVAVAAPEWTVPESAAPVADLGIPPSPQPPPTAGRGSPSPTVP